MRNLLLFILLIATLSCSINKEKEAETFASFSTDDASKLYFKNIRSSYYDVTELEAAKLETYRFKKRVLEGNEPIINLAIVNNWRYDEAYVLLEPNNNFSGLGDLKVRWSQDGIMYEEVFANTNKDSHVAFADIIYQNISKEREMEVWNGNEWLLFLNSSQSKETFRVTMVDYYRLVKRI